MCVSIVALTSVFQLLAAVAGVGSVFLKCSPCRRLRQFAIADLRSSASLHTRPNSSDVVSGKLCHSREPMIVTAEPAFARSVTLRLGITLARPSLGFGGRSKNGQKGVSRITIHANIVYSLLDVYYTV